MAHVEPAFAREEANHDKQMAILAILEETYGGAKPALHFGSPFQLLIAVMLSAQTNDNQVNKITDALFAACPDCAHMAQLSQEQLEAYIRTCGLYKNKAKNILATCQLLLAEYGGEVPACGSLTDYDRGTLAELQAVKATLEQNIENYRFREALKEAMNVARIGNKYLADCEPWKLVKTDPERVKTILNIALQITANLSIVVEPFMPFTAAKLLAMLRLEPLDWERIGATDLVAAGHRIGTPELLFEKIEDDVIQAQLDKLAATKEANLAAESSQNIDPQKDSISFDDFQRMDIRVSTILAAEKVAKTKKLLKLTVDTGIDRREIVSGIAEHYTPEELVGRQVLVLVNLEPRTLKGIESRGMILMGEDAAGKLVLLEPAAPVNSGAVVG